MAATGTRKFGARNRAQKFGARNRALKPGTKIWREKLAWKLNVKFGVETGCENPVWKPGRKNLAQEFGARIWRKILAEYYLQIYYVINPRGSGMLYNSWTVTVRYRRDVWYHRIGPSSFVWAVEWSWRPRRVVEGCGRLWRAVEAMEATEGCVEGSEDCGGLWRAGGGLVEGWGRK